MYNVYLLLELKKYAFVSTYCNELIEPTRKNKSPIKKTSIIKKIKTRIFLIT